MSEATASVGDTTREIPFDFRGQGMEYFKIWIVNLLLTIITLGIYSPWAKVRNTRYLYNHMYLDGHNFDYLANPVNILIGRLIALGVFIVFAGISQLFPVFGGLILLGVMLVFFPWIIVQSLRFRNRYSSYKNIRFNFAGDYVGALMAFMVWPLLGVLTAGLLMPLAWQKGRLYIVENSTYGTEPFAFDATIGDYYVMALKIIGFAIVAGIVIGGASILAPPLAAVAGLVFYLAIFAYVNQLNMNLQWNNTGIRVNAFTAEIKTGELVMLYLVNAILLVITLGLAYPAVKVRIARYYASRMNFVATEDLDTFIADEQQHTSAIGQEVGEFFDFDIGI